MANCGSWLGADSLSCRGTHRETLWLGSRGEADNTQQAASFKHGKLCAERATAPSTLTPARGWSVAPSQDLPALYLLYLLTAAPSIPT
ncbi:hypothetical protein NDU88_002162 [Pleurodeles waltl]|uniref:Uncharacterized protein n=1 Tax=Pleurodeles waltl TaxID=8319 RepID=A0AAV7UAG4_PLEWA|nr:hypothetical protein NDU88_002162 [Pleurodeles waltl]